jgi:hypothetical protein
MSVVGARVSDIDAEMGWLSAEIANAAARWHVNGGYDKKLLSNALIHAGIAMLESEYGAGGVAWLLDGWARDLRGGKS